VRRSPQLHGRDRRPVRGAVGDEPERLDRRHEDTLKDPKYKGLVLDGVVYGNDDPQISTTQAQACSRRTRTSSHHRPDHRRHRRRRSGRPAAKKTGSVFVTGLGTPKGMQDYVKGGEAPEFALWNVTDLGYLAYASRPTS